ALGIGVADHVARLAAAEQRGDHDHHDHDRDVEAGRDQERLLERALDDLAARDESVGLAGAPSAATASRNRSVSVGRSRLKYVTEPAARAASSTASGPAAACRATSTAPGAEA